MEYFSRIFVVCASVLLEITPVLSQTSASNMVLEKFSWCNNVPQQPFRIFVRPRDFNPGFQRVDINLSFPAPVGNDVSVKLSLDLNTEITATNVWIPLFRTEGEMCKLNDMFLGEIWYDMQRSMGVLPRSCPFPKGSYHAVNHAVDFNKMKLQGLPLGKTQATVRYSNKTSKETLACHVHILSSMSAL